MRQELDEERDILRTILSDSPIASTHDQTIGGVRHVIGHDADGNVVSVEIHGVSALAKQRNKSVRRTYEPDRQATDPIGTIKWRINDVELGSIVAEGTKQVLLGEVTITTIEGPSTNLASKSIPLTDDFSLSLSTSRSGKAKVVGFALKGERTDLQTFSWDWFNVDGPKHATKIQEPGEMRFAITRSASLWEIAETEFLTDVSVRISRINLQNPEPITSWRIEVEQGSHILWPCVVGDTVTLLPSMQPRSRKSDDRTQKSRSSIRPGGSGRRQ